MGPNREQLVRMTARDVIRKFSVKLRMLGIILRRDVAAIRSHRFQRGASLLQAC